MLTEWRSLPPAPSQWTTSPPDCTRFTNRSWKRESLRCAALQLLNFLSVGLEFFFTFVLDLDLIAYNKSVGWVWFGCSPNIRIFQKPRQTSPSRLAADASWRAVSLHFTAVNMLKSRKNRVQSRFIISHKYIFFGGGVFYSDSYSIVYLIIFIEPELTFSWSWDLKGRLVVRQCAVSPCAPL